MCELSPPDQNVWTLMIHLTNCSAKGNLIPFVYRHGYTLKAKNQRLNIFHKKLRTSVLYFPFLRWPALPCCIVGCICPPRGKLCSEVNLGGVPEYPETAVLGAEELQPKAGLHLLHCPSL